MSFLDPCSKAISRPPRKFLNSELHTKFLMLDLHLMKMIEVTVKFFGFLKTVTKVGEVRICGHLGMTLENLVQELTARYGEEFSNILINGKTGQLQETYSIIVNGENMNLRQSFKTRLKNDDVVLICQPVAGGS